MAFKVRKTEYRAWPVTVRFQECDDAGVVSEVAQTFVGHFKPFSEAEHAETVKDVDTLFPAPKDGKLGYPEALRRNAEFFGRLMVGWGPEVQDDAGAPLPFSTAALTSMITGPDGMPISAAIFQAIFELRFGVAPVKNSSTSPAPGAASTASGEVETSSPTT